MDENTSKSLLDYEDSNNNDAFENTTISLLDNECKPIIACSIKCKECDVIFFKYGNKFI